MAKTKAARGAGRPKGPKGAKGGKGAKGAKGSRGPARAGRAAAGPRRKAPRGVHDLAPRVKRVAPTAVPALPDTSRPTAVAIAKAGLDKKAEDVTVLDVRGLTSYADYFVVMTAESERQASAIADHVEDTMKDLGVSKVSVEGYETGRWILVDYGDVVAHVMNRESRGFYDLEGLWADAPRFQVEG